MNELHIFAGCGGGILGGMLLGHTCVCAVEIKEYRRRVLLQRQRDGIFPRFPVWDDVCTFDGRPWKGQAQIVAGGFPCQDISPSGNRTGLQGAKSGLWRQMARIVGEVEPAIVFVENSAMLIIRGLDRVLSDLAEMGFDAKWGVLGAADAIWLEGTPIFDHERYRCFVKATHPNRAWKLQPQRSIGDQWGRTSNGTSAPSYTNSLGQQSEKTAEAIQVHKNGNASPFERFRGRVSMPTSTADNQRWWADEPGVGRVVHGLANRDDRIGAIGDGQVPAVVKLAWETLI